ncbi:hypothetical protein ACJBX0_10235, partial [Streptococcus suis]
SFPIKLEEDHQPAQSNSARQDSETNEFEKDETAVQIDFKPKQRLAYKLPSIDLFAPIKAKSQASAKRVVSRDWIVGV